MHVVLVEDPPPEDESLAVWKRTEEHPAMEANFAIMHPLRKIYTNGSEAALDSTVFVLPDEHAETNEQLGLDVAGDVGESGRVLDAISPEVSKTTELDCAVGDEAFGLH